MNHYNCHIVNDAEHHLSGGQRGKIHLADVFRVLLFNHYASV